MGRVTRLQQIRQESLERAAVNLALGMAAMDLDLAGYWEEYAVQLATFYEQVEERSEILVSEILKGSNT